MKTFLAILIFAFVVSSCKKEEQSSRFVVDLGVGITVTDKDGVDLLNPSNPGAYLSKDIKIFALTNGIKQEVYHPNYDLPRDFFINDETEYNGKFWMVLFLYTSPDEAYPVTYIQWNENDTDTLKCDVYRSEGIISVKNVWLNDSLAWKAEDYAKGPRNIKIIK